MGKRAARPASTGCMSVYYLYVGSRRERSAARKVRTAGKRYPIRVTGYYPGYLEVEAGDLPQALLKLIFRGCGARRVLSEGGILG